MDIDSIVQTIKESVTARDVANALGIRTDRHGRCACPIHNGQDANMRLYPGSGGYHCFVCGASGDVIALVQAVMNCKFGEAVEWLNQTFSLGLDMHGKHDRKAEEEAKLNVRLKRSRQRQDEQIDRLLYDCYVLSGMLLNGLEQDAEKNRPRRPYGEWPEQYGAVMHLLPEARALNEWLTVLVMEAKK